MNSELIKAQMIIALDEMDLDTVTSLFEDLKAVSNMADDELVFMAQSLLLKKFNNKNISDGVAMSAYERLINLTSMNQSLKYIEIYKFRINVLRNMQAEDDEIMDVINALRIKVDKSYLKEVAKLELSMALRKLDIDKIKELYAIING